MSGKNKRPNNVNQRSNGPKKRSGPFGKSNSNSTVITVNRSYELGVDATVGKDVYPFWKNKLPNMGLLLSPLQLGDIDTGAGTAYIGGTGVWTFSLDSLVAYSKVSNFDEATQKWKTGYTDAYSSQFSAKIMPVGTTASLGGVMSIAAYPLGVGDKTPAVVANNKGLNWVNGLPNAVGGRSSRTYSSGFGVGIHDSADLWQPLGSDADKDNPEFCVALAYHCMGLKLGEVTARNALRPPYGCYTLVLTVTLHLKGYGDVVLNAAPKSHLSGAMTVLPRHDSLHLYPSASATEYFKRITYRQVLSRRPRLKGYVCIEDEDGKK